MTEQYPPHTESPQQSTEEITDVADQYDQPDSEASTAQHNRDPRAELAEDLREPLEPLSAMKLSVEDELDHARSFDVAVGEMLEQWNRMAYTGINLTIVDELLQRALILDTQLAASGEATERDRKILGDVQLQLEDVRAKLTRESKGEDDPVHEEKRTALNKVEEAVTEVSGHVRSKLVVGDEARQRIAQLQANLNAMMTDTWGMETYVAQIKQLLDALVNDPHLSIGGNLNRIDGSLEEVSRVHRSLEG